MRSTELLLASCALIGGAGSGPVVAEEPALAQLTLGVQVNEALDAADERAADFVYDVYHIRARSGQRLEFVMRSQAFDTYLELLDDRGAQLAADDDGLNEGTNSRLRFVTEERAYILRARTLSGHAGGPYSLLVFDRGVAPPIPLPGSIVRGQTISGELTAVDPEADESGATAYTYDAYTFQARQGKRVHIAMQSGELDPYLRIGSHSNASGFVELASNDDAGDGTNAGLVFLAPATGDYILRASHYGGDRFGAYTVSVNAAPPLQAARVIRVGDSIDGTLSPRSSSGIDVYRFEARRGQRMIATMRSDDFDTLLEVFSTGPLRQSLSADDDGLGSGTDSALMFEAPEDGIFEIEAKAYSGEDGGRYTLSLEPARREPEPTHIRYGETVRGSLVPDRTAIQAGDQYVFSGVEGERIELIMRSFDFDTLLTLRAEGSREDIDRDDDGLGSGTDSRIEAILPTSGRFVIRARGFSEAEGGEYTLRVNRLKRHPRERVPDSPRPFGEPTLPPDTGPLPQRRISPKVP